LLGDRVREARSDRQRGLMGRLRALLARRGKRSANVAFTAPFCTWLLRGFFMAIPKDIDEAAAVDGAGPWRTMGQVVLPLLAPGIATIAVYAFVFAWTEFVFASQLLVSDELKTLPIGLSQIMGLLALYLLFSGVLCEMAYRAGDMLVRWATKLYRLASWLRR
jgi:ABC-type glycerol-3-phosphate transport system permease component